MPKTATGIREEPAFTVLQSKQPEWDPFVRFVSVLHSSYARTAWTSRTESETRGIVMQFGRVGKDVFTMDFKVRAGLGGYS